MSKKTKKKGKDKSILDDLTITFKEGDLVGSRVKGYPLWPGFIEKVDSANNKPRYTVRFFHSNDTSQQHVELKHFRDFTKKELECKRSGFREALKLCQEEHNKLVSDRTEEPETIADNDDPGMVITLTKATKNHDDEPVVDNELKIDESKESRKPKEPKEVKKKAVSKQSVRQKRIEHKNNDELVTARSNNQRDDGKKIAKKTIMKLTNKIEKKLKEKEVLKKKKKEGKLTKKLIDKLDIINGKLELFLKFTDKLKRAYCPNSVNLNDCESAVQMFVKTLPALNRCIVFIMEGKVSKSSEPKLSSSFHKCEQTIRDIVLILQEVSVDDKLPLDVKKFARRSKKEIKNYPDLPIKNETRTIAEAIIERKENNIKQ